jgi:hypothetical protein
MQTWSASAVSTARPRIRSKTPQRRPVQHRRQRDLDRRQPRPRPPRPALDHGHPGRSESAGGLLRPAGAGRGVPDPLLSRANERVAPSTCSFPVAGERVDPSTRSFPGAGERVDPSIHSFLRPGEWVDFSTCSFPGPGEWVAPSTCSFSVPSGSLCAESLIRPPHPGRCLAKRRRRSRPKSSSGAAESRAPHAKILWG